MNAPTEGMRLVGSLNERYTAEQGWLYLTGIQALVRLPIQQRLRDAAAGLNTGGYISGYRGSPLGRYDIELWGAQDVLNRHRVVFRPGVNEDLAATAIWGAQYVGVFPGATVDGVFGIWIAQATRSDMPILPAPRSTAACWRWRAMTMAPNRPRSPTIPI
jgi:indolepyruvate ferredoxin oxidoreductase